MSRRIIHRSPRRSSVAVRLRLWARHLSPRLPSYLFQCGMATVSLVIILLVEDAVFRAATVVAVASSAFTICPPAAGTALGLVIHGWSWSAVVFILSSALALSMIRLVLRPRLINLL